jgi:DNA-binding transcriptional ArsR family regulator
MRDRCLSLCIANLTYFRGSCTTLTPTGRLIVIALRASKAPMTIAELAIATGATPTSMAILAGKLSKVGVLVKSKVGTIRYYDLTDQHRAA